MAEYRLLGYELRGLTREQFNDDKVDAGDIGAGHQVTALYEIVPRGVQGNVDALRYGREVPQPKAVASNQELAWVKLRYKTPGEKSSQLIELPVLAKTSSSGADENEAQFATAVAAWAQWLRGSSLIGDFTPQQVLAMAQRGKGEDRYGRRAEFLRLVKLSMALRR